MPERRTAQKRRKTDKIGLHPKNLEKLIGTMELSVELAKFFPSVSDSAGIAGKIMAIRESIHLSELEKTRAEIDVLQKDVEAKVKTEEEKNHIRVELNPLYRKIEELEESGEPARRRNP